MVSRSVIVAAVAGLLPLDSNLAGSWISVQDERMLISLLQTALLGSNMNGQLTLFDTYLIDCLQHIAVVDIEKLLQLYTCRVQSGSHYRVIVEDHRNGYIN